MKLLPTEELCIKELGLNDLRGHYKASVVEQELALNACVVLLLHVS